MTSLQKQLERLKTPATSALSVEKEHASLLFDKKEAATLDRESVYKIGITGLNQLAKLDENFPSYEPDLFDETKLNFNRAMVGKEENEKLDKSLERMIVYLAPYFNHQACKQVLEWLLYKFQIHCYNAEFLAMAFLLYHSTNSYGRLLKILKLKKSDWAWASEYTKKGMPIPFNVLIKQCSSGAGNYYLIGNYSNFLMNSLKLVEEEYVKRNLQSQFTFFASLCASLFEDSSKVNDLLIARVVPSVATALNSKIAPFKYAGMMIVCQMVSVASLSNEVLTAILKLILLKMKPDMLEIALNAAIVICQRQNLSTLPTKAIRKLILRDEELGLSEFLTNSMKLYDLTNFFIPFWNTIFEILKEATEDDENKALDRVLVITFDIKYTNEKQAEGFFRSLFHFLDESGKNLDALKETKKQVRAAVLRFPSEFEDVQSEWNERNPILAKKFLCDFNLESLEVSGITIAPKENKKKRRRSPSVSESKLADLKISKREQLSNLQESNGKKALKKDLLSIFTLIQNEKIEKGVFSLESAASPEYIKKQPAEEINEFIFKAVQYASKKPNPQLIKSLKLLLNQLTWDPKSIIVLLTPYSATPNVKRSKPIQSNKSSPFESETKEEFSRRLIFVLEILNVNNNVKSSHELLAKLFDLIDRAITDKDTDIDYIYVQQLSISLLERFLKDRGVSLWLEKNSARLDSLVKVVRFTTDQSALRNSLRILSSVASFLTKPVLAQLMSVFAFMGDGGLLRKDNELTLSIIEETLSALFNAIQKTNGNEFDNQKLLEISKAFGGSIVDIPAHRRIRVLNAFVKSVPMENMWILLTTMFDEFILKWQRDDAKKQDVEVLDDILIELIGSFDPEKQIETVLNILDYVISLGGDSSKPSKSFPIKITIFDRNSRSLQKLRHFRFIIFGWIIKYFSNQSLYERLSTLDDEELNSKFLKIGKRILITVTSLSDLVDSELSEAEQKEKLDKNSVATQTLKYWIALAGRADVVSEKFRCLLPANISGHVVCDILDDVSLDARHKQRALQLFNAKLLQPNIWQHAELAVHLPYLIKIATTLNEWVSPAEERNAIALCQSAAFTLRLLSKRLPTNEMQEIFAMTMERCIGVMHAWNSLDEAMVGSVLILLGELMRSQKLKGILLHTDEICKVCKDILVYCEQHVESKNDKSKGVEDRYSASRRRRTTQSTTGKQYGEDALLICAMTCMQRLLDHLPEFISTYYEPFICAFCEISAKFEQHETLVVQPPDQAINNQRHGNICIRLAQIRQSFARLEFRLIKEPIAQAIHNYIKNPMVLLKAVYLLEVIIKGLDLPTIQKSLPYLMEVFFKLFKFRRSAKIESVKIYDSCDRAIVSCFLVLLNNLSENDLRPILEKFASWVEEAIKPETKVAERNKLITIMLFANKFYDEYTTLALPHFGKLFALLSKLLRGLNVIKPDVPNLAVDEPMDSDEKYLLFEGKKGSIQEYHARQLSDLVLELVTKTSKV